MNLYKVNSFSNIQKEKKTKKYSNIKTNKQNSTLTGTTTCSYMKHSSIYYEKKTAKPIKRRHIFYQNEILLLMHIISQIVKINIIIIFLNNFPIIIIQIIIK